MVKEGGGERRREKKKEKMRVTKEGDKRISYTILHNLDVHL